MALLIKKYDNSELTVNATDVYSNSFALLGAKPTVLATLLLDILEARNPRMNPTPPETVIRAVRDSLASNEDRIDGIALMQKSLWYQKKLATRILETNEKRSDDAEAVTDAMSHLGTAAEAAITMTAMEDRLVNLLGPERAQLSTSGTWAEVLHSVRSKTSHDTDLGIRGLVEFDAITAFTREMMAGFFSTEQLKGNELMRKDRRFYIAEVTRGLGAVLAALQTSAEVARIWPIIWIMQSPYVWGQIEEKMGGTGSRTLDVSVTQVERLRDAMSHLTTIPQGPLTLEILNRLRPGTTSTLFGPREAFYMLPAVAKLLRKGTEDMTRWDPSILVNMYGDEIVAVTERIRDHQTALDTGWSKLGYRPSTGSGPWPMFYESSPMLWSTTGWSQAAGSPLDAAYIPRFVAAQNQLSNTQRMDSLWHQRGLTLSGRTTELTFDLSADVPLFIETAVITEPMSLFPRKWEPGAYRPFSEWTGEDGPTFHQLNCDVGQFATMLGLSLEETEEYILKNPGPFADFFDIDEKKKTVKTNLNVRSIFRTWITVNQPVLREIRIPYVGPTECAVRIDRDTWIWSTFVARYDVNMAPDSLPFQTVNLKDGGLNLDHL